MPHSAPRVTNVSSPCDFVRKLCPRLWYHCGRPHFARLRLLRLVGSYEDCWAGQGIRWWKRLAGDAIGGGPWPAPFVLVVGSGESLSGQPRRRREWRSCPAVLHGMAERDTTREKWSWPRRTEYECPLCCPCKHARLPSDHWPGGAHHESVNRTYLYIHTTQIAKALPAVISALSEMTMAGWPGSSHCPEPANTISAGGKAITID